VNDLNKPSFFRKGGLAVLGADQRLTAGKNPDGSYYIDIAGRHSARANMTPQQTFALANGLLRALGYQLEIGNGPTGEMQ
jgi:hypothetical protein